MSGLWFRLARDDRRVIGVSPLAPTGIIVGNAGGPHQFHAKVHHGSPAAPLAMRCRRLIEIVAESAKSLRS